jgi:hypothetical protein
MIIRFKISNYVKNFKGNNKKEFLKGLNELIQIRNKIYNADEKTITNILNEYKQNIIN